MPEAFALEGYDSSCGSPQSWQTRPCGSPAMAMSRPPQFQHPEVVPHHQERWRASMTTWAAMICFICCSLHGALVGNPQAPSEEDASGN
jgi:hypothetical protein